MYRLVKRLKGIRVLLLKFVFNLKYNVSREVIWYKARWIIYSNHQVASINYNQMYAIVVTLTAYRILLVLITVYNLKAYQVNIITAFLNSFIRKHSIYVRQSKGFKDQDYKLVCLLLKAIYGLKQAPLLWYNTLIEYLKTIGFKLINEDSCVF